MDRYRKSLIRRCEVFGATAATAVAILGRWWWLKRTSLDCRGRLRLPRKDQSYSTAAGTARLRSISPLAPVSICGGK